MEVIIWAFGSMLVLMLIISFLPLGFTLKGRFFVVFTGFVLALGGLAAAASFSLWLTVIMLLILAFFAAYMLDSRMGGMLYKKVYAFEEKCMNQDDFTKTDQQIEKSAQEDLFDLTDVKRVPSLIDLEESVKREASLSYVPAHLIQGRDSTTEIEDEDISFLQDRNNAIEVEKVWKDSESGYLFEIESLLEDDDIDSQKTEEKDWLDELVDLPLIDTEDHIGKNVNELKHSELELLIASEEAAAGTHR